MRLLLLLLLASLVVTACGQKGALYKTPASEVNQTSEPAVEANATKEPAEIPNNTEQPH
ncbi:LPS translocon maturation chaperone LptM [Shewanella aestuarii]|nr:lipoprotein [Shewanella aestuarii]